MGDHFILTEEVQKLQQNDMSNYDIPNEVIITGKNDPNLPGYLNEIADSIEVSAENISDPVVFDKIRSFLKNFTSIPPRILSRLFDILLSAFRVEVKSVNEDLDQNEKDTFNNHRIYLEHYAYLVYWFLMSAEDNTTTTKNTRKTKVTGNDLKSFDWSAHKLKAFDLINWLLALKLSKIWTLTSDRTNLVNLFTKPAYQLLENHVQAKSRPIKDRVFRTLSLCIKDYEHLFVAQTTIMQHLQYWEHSAEPMAELLVFMVEKENYNQLADEILRDISNREFKDTTSKEMKDSPNPKTFASFLTKMTELSPKTILKNLVMLINQLDSDSYIMRSVLIDILGAMIVELLKTSQENENQLEQINDFFDILEQRMLDPIAHTRQKVLQVYIRLFELKIKYPSRRQTATELAIRHLQDKSSMVRKNAIRLLTVLVSTHLFSLYGGELNLDDWNNRLDTLKTQVESVTTKESRPAFSVPLEEEGDSEMTEGNKENRPDEPTTPVPNELESTATEQVSAAADDDDENTGATSTTGKKVVPVEILQQMILVRTICIDAVRFIEQLHLAIPIIIQLLSSKSKAEVLESMDFLVTGFNYKIKPAANGIKKMLHLIWTKDTSDEGKGIKMKLLSCYQHLYLEMDQKLSKRENVASITKNLIQLTFDTNLAELTSLEEVLSTLMVEHKIAYDIIDKLWDVYGFTRGRIQKAQRRGAIMILGMLAKSKTKIVSDKVELMLKVGLGPLGKADLSLAKYTCIALQRLEGVKTKEKSRGVHEGIRFPIKHHIFARLKDVIENPSVSIEWFGLAEQAINTIYLLCETPETVCEDIIRKRILKVFGSKEAERLETESEAEAEGSPSVLHNLPSQLSTAEYDPSMTQSSLPFPHQPIYQHPNELSQLLFLAGHVALKEIVHLEIVESAWKRKKDKKEIEESKTEIEDELEQVGGTAEDDIGDAMFRIREREILFGAHSLLGRFGPLLTEVCARNKVYTDRTLQVTATLALAKFMCVSSEFCEKNLQLLFTILEKSTDATIRSNIVIALGDMAVCFSTLIDDNITFLYNRLSDTDVSVRKNTVMVLTHLILNGMVKVKGQISEMAKCLEDSDQRIVDLAKLFFTELSSKDNAIYNNLPDIISNLTSTQPDRLEEESFRRIMKFIFSFDFTEKEKQAENIVDKLCLRFLTAQDERNWRDIAYCLSLLPFKSERSFKKLVEGWPSYQDKVHEESVHKSLLEIISKARAQKNQRPELKSLVDEFEQKIEKQKGHEVVVKSEKVATKKLGGRSRASTEKKEGALPRKRDLRKRKRTFDVTDSEEEQSEDEVALCVSDTENNVIESSEDEETDEEDIIVPRSRRKASQEQKKKEEEEEEGTEDEEEEDDD